MRLCRLMFMPLIAVSLRPWGKDSRGSSLVCREAVPKAPGGWLEGTEQYLPPQSAVGVCPAAAPQKFTFSG